jgi:ribosome-associated protein
LARTDDILRLTAPGAAIEGLELSHQALSEAGPSPLPSSSGASASASEDPRSVALHCLEDMKAEDTVEIDLAGKTSIADFMIVSSGRSHRHVGAIAEKVIEALKAAGHGNVRVEGLPACDWVLIDGGDVLVHVFRPEVRSFYNLEKMWGADRPQAERIAV